MKLVLCLLLITTCACGDYAAAGDGGDTLDSGSDGGPTVDPSEPAPAPPPLGDAALASAKADITTALNSVPYTRSVRVENLSTGQVIFTENPALLLKPASNTKLYTTAAALEILSADHELTTRVVGTAAIDAQGTLAGDLHIIAEHDPTATPLLYGAARDPLDRLALALAARGLKKVSGSVYLEGELIYVGDSLGTLDVAAQRAAALAPLDAALTAAGIMHTAPMSSATLAPPAGATPILIRSPLPLLVAVSPLNVESHNELADLLIRHLGWKIVGTSSFAAGAQARMDWLMTTGIPTTGLVFEDGSGLSHNNRTCADSTVALLRYMEGEPVGPAWRRTLSISGVRGTLQNRLTDSDTRGHVFAKTGTLSDTIALSGFLEHLHDGQRYVFSVMLNAVTTAATARDVVDDVVRAIAKDLRKATSRLAPPRLRWSRGVGAAGYAEVAWAPVTGATGYVVWRSSDGERWPYADARLYHGEHATIAGLAASAPTYFRVSALDAAGLLSDPSVVHAVTALASATTLLLVDGNDRWFAEPQAENTLRAHHRFLVPLAVAAAPRTVASVDDDEIESGAFALTPYPCVLWAGGEESEAQGALTPAQRTALANYVAGSGALLLSGAELVWNLDQKGGADEHQFLASSLQAAYVADSASTYEVEPVPGGALAAVPTLSFISPDGLDARYADVLKTAGASVPLLRYVGGVGGNAIVGVPGKVIVSGFPVEAIVSDTHRTALIGAALGFLGH